MEFFKTNQNKAERILRFIVSVFLIPAPIIIGASTYTFIICGVGAILLFNAISGACMIYKIFGVDTCKI
tara:strand:+ start:1923 stop:2129 length:207 start_codon:yes stop_codon:yes gene_type:complete